MPSLIDLGGGRFRVRVRVKDSATGKWSFKSQNVKGGKREAERVATELQSAKNQGTLSAGRRLTLAEYAQTWLEVAATSVSYRTHEGYENNLRLHVLPTLGRTDLQKLTPLMLQRLYLALRRKGLSARSIRYVHATIRRALGRAVNLGLLTRNPAVGVDLPKLDHWEAHVLNDDQARRLLQAVAGTRLAIPVLVSLTTGLRRGEVAGLTWNRLDLDRGLLTVVQSLQRQRRKGLVVAPTKSHRSRRPVALSPGVVAALREWRREQVRERLAAGPAWAGGDWVCTHASGTPVSPDEITKGFRDLADGLGLKGVRFHDLRHTCATMLLMDNVNPKVVQERLGHSSVTLTLDTYSHLVPSLQREAANGLDRLLAKA